MSQSQPFVGQTPLFGTGRHSELQRISTVEQKFKLSGADDKCELDTTALIYLNSDWSCAQWLFVHAVVSVYIYIYMFICLYITLLVSPSARNQPKTTHNDDKIQQVKDVEVFHHFYFILKTFRAQT